LEGRLPLRVVKDRITEFKVLKLNQRQSDKKLRARVSFVLDGTYGVTGYIYYQPGTKENTLWYVKFVPGWVFQPSELAGGKDRLLGGGRKATAARRIPPQNFEATWASSSHELIYKYKGSETLQDVECVVSVVFDKGNKTEIKRSWPSWRPNEEKKIALAAADGTPQSQQLDGKATVGSEPVVLGR